MIDDQRGDANPRQHYIDLSNEVADILLDPDSPVRGLTEFDELIAEHDRLHSRQAALQALDAKLVNVIPGLEQAEAKLAAAEKQLAAGRKKLAGFARELGKAAFAGLRAGELPDNSLFADRKALQTLIETLQRQRFELSTGENARMVEKAKIQAQQLKLTGQIKIEELKIGSSDRALGVSMLTSKEKLSVRCSHTEEVLKAIVSQRKQVAIAKEQVNQAETRLAERGSAAADTLARSSLNNASSLKSELKDVRKEHRQNEHSIATLQSSVVAAALETTPFHTDAVVGEKLKQLRSLNFDLDANKTQGMKLVDESVSRFKRLPTKVKFGAYAVAGVLLLLLLMMSFFGGDGNEDEVASKGSGKDVSAVAEVAAGMTDTKETETQLSEEDAIREVGRIGGSVKSDLETGGWIVDFPDTVEVNDVSMLRAFDNLSSLTVRKGSLSGDRLAPIANATQITSLGLTDCNLDDRSLAHLSELSKLEWLNLDRNKFTDQGLMHLAKLDQLSFLFLGRNNITDVGLAHVTKLQNIYWLRLTFTNLTGASFGQLGNLTKLDSLDLKGCVHLDEQNLRQLSKCKKLQALDLTGCDVVSGKGLPARLSKSWTGKQEIGAMLANISDSGSVHVELGEFSYTIGSRNYIGTITEGSDRQHQDVFPDSLKDRVGVMINYEEGLIDTTPLGITDGHLHAGSGRENIYIFLHFSVQGRDGIRPVDGKPNYPVRGFVEAIYLTLGPVQQTHFFSKRASQVSPKQQEMLFKTRAGLPVIRFGVPNKVETELQRDRILYADFSPSNQLAQFRGHLDKSDLIFTIGNRSFQVDESARQQLFLFERAVEVMRYHKGARDFESRKSLGD